MNCLWILLLLCCCNGSGCGCNSGRNYSSNSYGRSSRSGNGCGYQTVGNNCGCDNDCGNDGDCGCGAQNRSGNGYDNYSNSGTTRFPQVSRSETCGCDEK